MRIKKTDANIDTNYVYNGTQLVAEYVNEYSMSNKKLYFYDESGNLYAMKYDDSMYYYIRNATNDN
ncbi:MAG: hypothetical protein RR073_05390 [Clostridia bacterium]